MQAKCVLTKYADCYGEDTQRVEKLRESLGVFSDEMRLCKLNEM